MRILTMISSALLVVALSFTTTCTRQKETVQKPAPVQIKPNPGKSSGKSNVDDDCMHRCMTRNAMRSIGAEQIEYDCELDCRIR